MRAIILLLLACFAYCADEELTEPKHITAEESAKIMAEVKAKKEAAAKAKADAAAKDPAKAGDAEPTDADKKADTKRMLDNKEQDAIEGKLAKARRDAEDYEKKATTHAKQATACAKQFMLRASAEKGGMSSYDLFRRKVVLHETGGTNQSVLDEVVKVKDFLEKCDAARTAAGMDPLPSLWRRNGGNGVNRQDVVDWIHDTSAWDF